MKKLSLAVVVLSLFLNSSYAADIPADHMALISSTLKKILSLEKPDSISVLSGGYSSPGLYKISVAGRAYVFRFSSKKQSKSDRLRELEAMQISSACGIAPKILYANLDEGIIVMEFIVASSKSAHFESLSYGNLRKLAGAIRTVHEGPAFGKAATAFEVARQYEGEMKGERPAIIIQASKLLDKLQLELKDQLVEKPCHYDIHPGNILFSKEKVYFIDWEGASQGEPFFDLATPAIFYAMNEAQEKIFLTSYFGRKPTQDEISKYQKIKRVNMILHGFVLVMISQRQGEELISAGEINKLPHAKLIAQNNKLKEGPKYLQRIGFALLREALAG